MNTENMNLLEADLKAVCDKYGLTDASFCATETATNEYVGLFCQKMTMTALWQAVLNVARWWQHCRNTTREQLNNFEHNKYEW